MEPLSVGYNAHNYWIFDIVWLDDEHVVSGAGDNRLALWSINSDKNNNNTSSTSSFITQKKSMSLSNSFQGASSSQSPQPRPSMLHRSWSGQNLRSSSFSFSKNSRFDRRHLKRASPASPAAATSSSRFRSPAVVRSPYFHNFYNNAASSSRSTRAGGGGGGGSHAMSPSSASQPTTFLSASLSLGSSHRHRFNFRSDATLHTTMPTATSIYNINGSRASPSRSQSRFSGTSVSSRSPM